MTHDRILILDFGSQVTQLIARRVREAHVYCEVHPNDVSESFIREFNPKGIILSGSHMSAYEESTDRISDAVFNAGVPILGICYGMQTMAQQLGGKVENIGKREFGYAEVKNHNNSTLLKGIEDMKNEAGETHTLQGRALLNRFVLDICKAEPSWIMGDYVKEAVEQIRAQVGDEEVILGLSGGVDSSVTAALIHRAIGKQLTCVFVDNGLLRKNEREQVRETFEKNMGLKLIVVDAVDRFMGELAGVTDPEQKRKIIGRLFVEVFQEEAAKLPNAKWLAQGTIYPDVIESAGAKTKKAKTIKSHHNVGGLPDTLHLKLLEPLRGLFKDEVRELGVALGLPAEMVYRHPFPGPGLGVRILGEVKKEYADLLREADAIFIEELRKAGLYDKVSQAFVVFLPVKSVGVMGDGRTYEWVVSLRSVETSDFMTARWSHLPYELLGTVSNRIINEVRGINRVCYDISGKPPATIEWE